MKRLTLSVAAITAMMAAAFFFPAVAKSDDVPAGADCVYIIGDEYGAGNQTILVYSNVTVAEYKLIVNDTIVDDEFGNITIPRKGYWNATGTDLVTNHEAACPVSSLVANDTEYYTADSVRTGTMRNTVLEIYFSIHALGFDVHVMENTTISFSIATTAVTTITTNVVEYWSVSTSSWQLFTTLTVNGVKTVNSSMNVVDNIRALDDCFVVRVRQQQSGSGFSLNASYLNVYYEYPEDIPPEEGYIVVDEHHVDSTLWADGIYNVTAWINDSLGVTHQYTTWLEADNTAPVITSFGSSPASPTTAEVVTITATIVEKNIGAVFGRYLNTCGEEITTSFGTDGAVQFCNYFSNGTYIFHLYVIDLAGNTVDEYISFTVTYYDPPGEDEDEDEDGETTMGFPVETVAVVSITIGVIGANMAFIATKMNNSARKTTRYCGKKSRPKKKLATRANKTPIKTSKKSFNRIKACKG